MLHDFIPPAVPKEFAKSVMAKKAYLLAASRQSCPLGTPASFGIQRVRPPDDLDEPLADLFSRQDDERYRMKLRHQVERVRLADRSTRLAFDHIPGQTTSVSRTRSAPSARQCLALIN